MKEAHRQRQITAANIRAEMARAGHRQSDVAKWLNISQPSVSDKLKCKTPFDIDELGIIADQLGVPLAALVSEVEYAAPAAQFPGGVSRPGWAPRYFHSANLSAYDDAGWSSSVARWAHNPEILSPDEVPPIFPLITSPRWLESGLHKLERLANGESVAGAT